MLPPWRDSCNGEVAKNRSLPPRWVKALSSFEQLGVWRWAERARAELARVKVGAQSGGGLSVSERRVAELAAAGMTNREIAAALFVTPKTVEADLGRVYRKLGIRNRAEIAGHIDVLGG